ncbi:MULTISPECIES: hypothetical protein [Clostridium]|uniref:Uncharacterized protein n=2 Tax=Clostridium TaxID=1485 RepID=D8GK22_CLOLD|nr:MULTISPECIES: hypothetical protein [Clostridium]ADK13140.1 hypothetical protein CLJU_c00330 [Clostridium ljungdahlii DSM 13528]AGY76363.1 hypothetical protein CAETHG_2150 [Clostridium autoethanogenum DSM 10061]ALU36526.1 Hypothetical protein CLAU_2097 [Clostridium autoethanogenum DSM 10061]OAA84378.1 hypothetical protein WX45_01041 [Clostridium ljungdahlii DSM 13528]OVY48612.1 hypothetical protein WX72_00433 [Clostridium autoethanogenum]
MKCKACGYEHEGHYTEDNKYVTTKGDKPFIEVSQNIAVKEKDKFNNTKEILSTKLYACPNCGTVKMEEDQMCDGEKVHIYKF